ncbi:hypothetical protein [Desulfurivibrio alkaliphilus]|uniref:Uncharacterized protein n=1 Tax=Desulfurivibrio alkaliphilus (strain DSM 19089 / UNIQEM U267 / AHT2) TaxID=589865 RepID=D6Z4Q5_DESAT|nr:hypothetical protein [Desulfurivibrio alkaliphilus]ADH86530.1 hypothetical protein DaAHT2_1849 [Desulfurivibrio alkaliphilus AHT 2]
MVPYDETLLERSRTQWQFGDWQSLAQINRDRLQHHPDRAKPALPAAPGHLQCGTTAEAHRAPANSCLKIWSKYIHYSYEI